MPSAPKVRIRPNQSAVSRSAGPSLRAISSFMRLRGIGEAYHLAPEMWARPLAIACFDRSPVRL